MESGRYFLACPISFMTANLTSSEKILSGLRPDAILSKDWSSYRGEGHRITTPLTSSGGTEKRLKRRGESSVGQDGDR